jgi:glycosyltransferase involved in cell wall biosynthesis
VTSHSHNKGERNTTDGILGEKDAMKRKTTAHIVVLIPCLNEIKSIGKVIDDFHRAIPEAEIIVFDNGSVDGTPQAAQKRGARVLMENRRGKGYVVQAMFQRVEADIYVMVDGDDTYPADRVRALIEPVLMDEADMVIGSRMTSDSHSQFHRLNHLGNVFFQTVINLIFHTRLTDILSGYRVMNRRIAKGLPLFEKGFAIEAELTMKSLDRGYRLIELPVDLKARGEGSHSKIKIVPDGMRILTTILALFRDYKPFTFFGTIGMVLMLIGLIPGLRSIIGYWQTGMVQYFPSAILAVGIEFTGLLCIMVGLILHTLDRRFNELEHYIRVVNGRIQGQ